MNRRKTIKNKIMQYSNKEYNEKLHDRYKALTVKQPYAKRLVTTGRVESDNVTYGVKSIEVRSKNTPYRGDILICAAALPIIPGMESGVTMGFVELYDVKPVADFDETDWANTCIPEDQRKKITKGYGWLMRNPRRVIELPIKGQLGIFNLVYTKDEIMEYPKYVTL